MKLKKPHLFLLQPITPIVGFILQKDVYTTNLLYENDQFPTKSLRKTLPFHKLPWMMKTNPNSCVTILKEKNPNLEPENLINKKYLLRPKKLRNRRLKFPLPKMKTVPLGSSILNSELCKNNLRIKFLKDDYNITSISGRQFEYKIKKKTNQSLKTNDFNVSFIKNNYKNRNSVRLDLEDKIDENEKQTPLKTYSGENKGQKYRNVKYDKIHKNKKFKNILEKSVYELRKEINQINDDLKGINLVEKERKKSFYKKDFFTTQIYTKINKKVSAKY